MYITVASAVAQPGCLIQINSQAWFQVLVCQQVHINYCSSQSVPLKRTKQRSILDYPDQRYPNPTKEFWTTYTEGSIQIRTETGLHLVWFQNPFLFFWTHFWDLIQSDGRYLIRVLLDTWVHSDVKMSAAFPLLVGDVEEFVLKQQRESWRVESEGRPHVVSGVFDVALQLCDPHLQNRNSLNHCHPPKYKRVEPLI